MKKSIITFLLISGIISIFLGTTYTTITIDGTNDFESDEDVAGTNGSVWYFTWDENNFYIGANNDNIDDNSNTKWILAYIDSDPQTTPTNGTGTTTGILYNTQQPVLPFTANYHFRWKNDNTYTNLQQWNGSSWVDGDQTGISSGINGTFVEFKLPRNNIGSPNEIHIVAVMINEVSLGEFTFYMTPDGQTEGYDANYTKWFGFPLTTGISPDNPTYVDNPLPVELISFTAFVKDGTVNLKWQTATEINNYGFDIERSRLLSPNFDGINWENIGFVAGHGNTNTPQSYSFTDNSVSYGNYMYRLKQLDTDGSFEYSDIVEVYTGKFPDGFMLEQNYPNPFNPTTSIRFGLEKSAHATLKVYNSIGKEVATLFDENAEAGKIYNLKFSSEGLSSGVYIYRLRSDNFSETRKMIIMK